MCLILPKTCPLPQSVEKLSSMKLGTGASKVGDRWPRKHVKHPGDPAQRLSHQVWSGSGSPPISRPCPPPPPGILPQAQLLGLVTGMNPSISSADTRAHTHEKA